MHDTALKLGGLAFQVYCDRRSPSILEIGSYNVNGTLRVFAPEGCHYVGIDIEEGPGVDLVAAPGEPLPVDDGSFDLVVSTSVFEHDSVFWQTFLELCSKVRQGGYIYMNAPSNGAVHRFPRDSWRFYPDAGKALAEWARSQGQNVRLVESFTAPREADIWNDFVAVFQKRPTRRLLPRVLLHERVPGCINVQVGEEAELLDPQSLTEDMILIARAQEDAQGKANLAAALADAAARSVVQQEALGASRRQGAALQVALTEAIADVARLNSVIVVKDTEASERAARIAAAEIARSAVETTLERLERARGAAEEEVVTLRVKAKAQSAELAVLKQKLAEADEWVFRLAEARAAAQAMRDRARSEQQFANERLSSEIARADRLDEMLKKACANERRLQSELVTAHEAAADRDELTEALRKEETVAAQAREVLAQAIAAHSAEAARLEAENNQLRQTMHRLEAELAANCERSQDLARRFDEAGALAQSARSELAATQARLTDAAVESARLRSSLDQRERTARVEAHGRKLFQAMFEKLESAPLRWRVAPNNGVRRKLGSWLIGHGLFDPQGYLNRNPDVASSGMDPLRHFLLHGIDEGRAAFPDEVGPAGNA